MAKVIRKIEAAAAAVGYPEFLMDGLLLVAKLPVFLEVGGRM